MIDLGTRVYLRLAKDAESPNSDRVHVAMITRHLTETKVNLKVFPDLAAIFDASEVEMQGSEQPEAACWSPWIESLTDQPAQP
jgi:hypothetical protein